MKIRVGVLFGGRSAEHEVSLQSARNVVAALDPQKYEVVLIGIDREGRWSLDAAAGRSLADPGAELPALRSPGRDEEPVILLPDAGRARLVSGVSRAELGSLDVVFPVLHGPFGEDGTVQGLLKLADVPFVGAGVLGSAVGMDKDVMKRLLSQAGIANARCVVLRRPDSASFQSISRKLGTPVFVKPANMGSSVGISKVHTGAELESALDLAFGFDRKVLIEEFIEGREIECSVLGNDDPVASLPGEVIPHAEFYSYEAKYLDENGALLEIPARLDERTTERVRDTAVEAFRVLACEGMARVDSFLTPAGDIYVNEINTIPGFTRISMYPKLWEATGISYRQLVDRLIELAFERAAAERALRSSRRP